MTLFRQLLVFTLILFFLLFAGTWVALIEGTRTFLSEQLASHSQDTATSFGLSITPHIADADYATIETMMNAVFDRGYYKSIRLVDIEGKPLVERSMKVVIESVPEWFVEMVPLEAPVASSIVMAGWSQAGVVYVESNPGYAYKEFWNIALMMTLWFVLLGLFVAIFGGMGIRYLLKPLHRVEEQAEALTKRQYIIQEKLPRTRELNSVVRAMNNMTLKVKAMFEKQAAVAKRLQNQAYRDDLTGLGNRRYFEGQIKPRLERKEASIKGAVLLVQISDLKELNEQKGYLAGDALLQRVADILKDVTKSYGKAAISHLAGGDFGIFLPDVTPEDAEHIAESIVSKLPQLAMEDLSLSDNVGHAGCVIYTQSTSLGVLLSEADNMLRSAQNEGANKWQITQHSDNAAEGLGEQQWKEVLEDVLEKNNITLYGQSVVSAENKDNVIHKELFSRVIQDDGQVISAGVFMPLAERLGLVSALDRLVLKEAMKLQVGEIGIDKIAVNISAASMNDQSFMQELISAAREHPMSMPRIIFEFVEFSAIQHLDKLIEFRNSVGERGNGIALDHFGSSFSNFGYLQSLRPDYVKIDRAFTNEIDKEGSDSDFFVSSLCNVAHSLDIIVIAEGVENEQQWKLLNELGVDGMQGYFIDKPGPVKVNK